MTAIAIGCAILSAVCAAFGAHLQHTGVRLATSGGGLRLRMLRDLMLSRSWMLGFGTLVLCVVLYTTALTLAPVVVVAPIVALSLPIVAVLNARAGRFRLGGAARISVVASALAVAAFVGIATEVASETRIASEELLGVVRIAGIAIVAFAAFGLLSRGIRRCAAFSTAAGVAYGLVSVLVRDIGHSLRAEGFEGLSLVSLLGLAVVFLAGSWLVQLGYSSGPPDVVVGFHTVFNPVVASVIGMTVLGEVRDTGMLALAAMLLCGLVAVTGVTVLASRHPGVALRAAVTHPS